MQGSLGEGSNSIRAGGQECIRKDQFFGEIARRWEIFLVDLTVCKLQTC